MSAKVNYKFIGILAGVLGLVGIGVAYLAMNTLRKGPAEHFRASEDAAAKGNYEVALLAISKAVNKDPNNAQYLRAWMGYLTKTTPSNQQNYKERLEQYSNALRRLAEVESRNLDTQKQFLNLRFDELRRFPSDATRWSLFIQDVEKVTNRFDANSPERQYLRRYPGLARLALLAINFEMSDAERNSIPEDLRAALGVDATDSMSAAGLGDWQRLTARNAMTIKDSDAADRYLNEAKQFLVKHIADHPPAAAAVVSLLEVEMTAAFNKPKPDATYGQLFTSLQPRAIQIVEALEQEDPKNLDDLVVTRAGRYAIQTGVKDGYERIAKVFDKMIEARDNYPWYMLSKADFAFQSGHLEDNMAILDKIVALPDRPLSPEGLALFQIRDVAAMQKINTMMAQWQSAKEEEKPTLLKAIESQRASLDSRSGVDPKQKLYLDGVICFAKNDMACCRQKLNEYNQATNRQDIRALLLLSEALRRQNNLGEAAKNLERVLELDKGNMAAMVSLADIQFGLRKFSDAANLYQSAYVMTGRSDKAIAEKLYNATQLAAGTNAEDPVFKAIAEADALANGSTPDVAAAGKKLTSVENKAKDARQMALLAEALARLNMRAEAGGIVERGLKKYKDDPLLTDIASRLESKDIVASNEKRILDAKLPKNEELLQLYVLYKNAGRGDRANAMLDDLAKIDPENAVVVGAMFDRALFARDFKEAERLTALAKSKNLDKLNGLIFEMQLFAEQMKLDEAISAAKKATELDSLNPAAWRMLGRLLLARDGDRVGPDGKKVISTAGIDALQRAIQIKPDDAQAVTFLIQGLESAGRPIEALAIAREKQKLVSGDINFQNAWLGLEYRHGDKEKSIDLRDRIFAVNPSNLANAIELAKHRVETKSYDKAALIINKLRTLDLPTADTAPLTALEAAMLAGKGDNAGAMRVFNDLRTKLGETKGVEGELHVIIARLVADLGNFALARDILADGKSIENKRKMPVSREQGDLAFRVGDWAEACKAYANVRASSTPEDDADGRLARRYSEALIRNNQPAEAETVISELIAQNKGKPDPQLLMLSAEVLAGQGKAKEALERLDQAIAADPTNPLAWYRRAQIRSTQPNMQDQAIADLEQVLKINPKFSGGRVPLAIGYLQQSRYDKAVGVLRDGLTLEPQNSDLRANLIRLMVQNERTDDALTELAEAKKVSEDLSWWYMSGEIYSQRGAFRPAADEFKYVWDRRKIPQNAAAYAQALMAITPPQIPTAIEVLKSPELEVDKNVGLLLLRAYVNLQNKKPVEARVDVSKGMALLNKDDPGMVNDFFVELKKIYKPDELVTLMRDLTPPGGFPESVLIQIAAVKTANPALRAEGLAEIDRLCDAKTPVIAAAACRLRADLHYGASEYDQAITRWQQALKLEPNNPEALNNLAYTLSKHKGKPQDALEMSRKAVELMPSNANVLDTLGQVYLALGNYADAEQYLNRAFSLARDARSQAAPLIHLIETKIRKGDRPSADKSYQELQKLMEKARDNAPRLPDGSRAPTWVDTYKNEIDAVTKMLEAKG